MSNTLSQEKITEYRKILFQLDKKITDEILELLEKDPFKDPDHASDNAAIDTDVREQMGHAEIESEIESLKRRQALVAQAISKLDKHAFGICEKCLTPIAESRLRIVPEAKYCISCAKKKK